MTPSECDNPSQNKNTKNKSQDEDGSHDGQRRQQEEVSQQGKAAANNGKPRHHRDPEKARKKAKTKEALEVSEAHIDIIGSLFDEEDDFDQEMQDHDNWLPALSKTGQEGFNLIHRLILKVRALTVNPNSSTEHESIRLPARALEIIETLVLDDPRLFTTANLDQVPIFDAPKLAGSVDIFLRVLSLLIPQQTLKKLKGFKTKCVESETRCPLLEVAQSRREQCTKKHDIQTAEAPHLVGYGEPEYSGHSSNYCLHDEVDAKLVVEKDRDLREALREALSRDDPNGGGKRAHKDCIKSLLKGDLFDQNAPIQIQTFETLFELCPNEVFNTPCRDVDTPLQMAVKLYGEQSIDYDLLLSVIKALVERCPESIFLPAKTSDDKRTAYQMLMDIRKGPTRMAKDSIDRAGELLKEACIGYRGDYSEEKKHNLLYWDPQSEKRFYLTLAGESTVIDKHYITTMISQSGVDFETVLEFVKLPYWKSSHSSEGSVTSTTHENASTNRPPRVQIPRENPNSMNGKEIVKKFEPDPYKVLFEWLGTGSSNGKNKVRKIFTIEVDDNGPEPHTNAAIREALRGKLKPDGTFDRNFHVEVWNWKKFDICAETVAIAAPDAREVYLYSHGNTAVLSGWAWGSAIAKLKKLSKLFVKIVPKNKHDEMDCHNYQPNFIEGVRKQCSWLKDQDIQVEIITMKQPGEIANDNLLAAIDQIHGLPGDLNSNAMITKQKDWVGKLQGFNNAMHNFLRNRKHQETDPVVKVALLDDGVKLHSLEGEQIGRSFRPGQDWWVGPSTHGTEMASCIRSVCPMAKLYIARLDDSGRDKYTVKSCTEAIKWALKHEVDIISMSWSFEWTENEDVLSSDKQEFKNHVIEAGKKALLFAALPDEEVRLDEVAPVGLRGVIKIGSANRYGQASPENTHVSPDFILPGEDVDIGSAKKRKGSSYATAFASGLAAMVLCILRMHRDIAADIYDDKYGDKALKAAKTYSGMKHALERLSGSSGSKSIGPPFPQPYNLFRDLEGNKIEQEKRLETISITLMPPAKLNQFQS
ncbi:hypothetical protein F5Y10DRAFT_157680 [Nemania abortiva]|nr:hypothetical protein F5Y10DRAFT_157680 [Nemania abortiva]